MFQCFLVDKDEQNNISARFASLAPSALPEGDVLIRVAWSALNYKDALAAAGHPGVALALPLVPGIDALGTVVQSRDQRFTAGQTVFVSAADFGTRHWGGWSEQAQVPADWCFAVPPGLEPAEMIALGTAGFTAAQSVDQIQQRLIDPQAGPVVVTGATGGVGVFAVMLLSQLGYHVVASTGKPDRAEWLQERGASEIIDRRELNDDSPRPLLSGRWAAAVDTVGGNTLATVLRSTAAGGCVTACGLVGGQQLNMTVYPFILRGVGLQGIDSANTSRDQRQRIWNRLAGDYKIRNIPGIVQEVEFARIETAIARIQQGQVAGRTLIRIESS